MHLKGDNVQKVLERAIEKQLLDHVNLEEFIKLAKKELDKK